MKKNTIQKLLIFFVFLIFFEIKTVFSLEMNALEQPSDVCPCISSVYKILVTNDELIPRSVEIKTDSDEIEIVPNKLDLGSKEGKTILVFLTPDCIKKPGKYSFNLIYEDSNNQTFNQKINYEVGNCRKIEYSLSDKKICSNEKSDQVIKIVNTGKIIETISIDSSLGTINQTTQKIEPGESKEYKILLDEFKEPGEYSINVSFSSEDKYIYYNESFQITVDPCANFEIELSTQDKVCIKDQAIFFLNIKNTGKITDTYFVSKNNNIEPEKENITLEPGKEERIRVFINPEKLGEEEVVIRIKSKYLPEKVLSSKLIVEDCCGLNLKTTNNTLEICAGAYGEFSQIFELENNGFSSTFNITSDSNWIIPETDTINLSEDESIKFSTKIKPINQVGTYKTIIKAYDEYCEANIPITVKVNDCFGLEAELLDLENKTVCSEGNETIKLRIKNKGDVKASYEIIPLNPRELKSESNVIELNPEQETGINLFLNPEDLSGKTNIEVLIIQRDFPENKVILTEEVDIIRCYDFEFSIEDKETCSDQELEIKGIISNTGFMKDLFLINSVCPPWLNISTDKLYLDSEAKGLITITGTVPLEAENKRSVCSIIISSQNGNQTRTYNSNIFIKPNEECYCSEVLLNLEKITVKPGKSGVVEVNIRNCGEFNQTYECKVSENLDNISYINQEELTVEPGETEKCYIGIVPETTMKGLIQGNIIIKNKYQEIKKDLEVNIQS